MKVVVFTNKGCHNCEAVKTHLHAAGVAFSEMDASTSLDPKQKDYFERHPDWRTSGVVAALSLLQYNDNALPVIVIDGDAFTYKETLQKFPTPEKAPVDIVASVWNTVTSWVPAQEPAPVLA